MYDAAISHVLPMPISPSLTRRGPSVWWRGESPPAQKHFVVGPWHAVVLPLVNLRIRGWGAPWREKPRGVLRRVALYVPAGCLC